MLRTIEARIDEQGHIHLLEEVKISNASRALVIILGDEANLNEAAALSEQSLARDWNRPEEDEAWSHLK